MTNYKTCPLMGAGYCESYWVHVGVFKSVTGSSGVHEQYGNPKSHPKYDNNPPVVSSFRPLVV